MSLHNRVTELADEIACDMHEKYLAGSNDIKVPELKWVAYALSLQYSYPQEALVVCLEQYINERYKDMF